jgi:hypothetical protein
MSCHARRDWRKSSFSSGAGAMCVEVSVGPADVLVRDSKHRHGDNLRVDLPTWGAFLALHGSRRSSAMSFRPMLNQVDRVG